jgi:hypothetical protein
LAFNPARILPKARTQAQAVRPRRAAGNRLAPLAVAFRSYEAGQVSDGETVEVRGRWTT